MAGMINVLKTVAKAGWSYQYNRGTAIQVAEILKHMEMDGRTVSDQTRKTCDDYAQEMLGAKKYAPWLYVYCAIAGEFKEGWIPDNFYGEKVITHISGNYGDVSDLRALNTRLFGTEYFPDVAAYVNEMFIDRHGHAIPEAQVKDVVFSEGRRVVYKLDSSSDGAGIHFFDQDSFDLDAVRKLGAGLFQSFIVQHDFYNAYANKSVATLRLTTVCDDSGDVTLRSGFMRFGLESDSFVHGATTMKVGFDLETGKLHKDVYLHDWRTALTHPDTGVEFGGKQMPHYEECVEVAIALHRKLPFVRCVGWDMAVDVDGKVKIMEWNGEHNDIKFGEAIQGPCFRDMNWERFR